jgi:CheY-like chemotaxis protein
MDGVEATQKLRSSGMPGSKTVPILAMTANVFSEDIRHYIDIGMDDHIGKPLDPDELISKLAKVMK